MANVEMLNKRIIKQNAVIEGLRTQLDLYTSTQTELQVLNRNYVNQINDLITNISIYNSQGASIKVPDIKIPLVDTTPTIDIPKQRLFNKITNMKNAIRIKDHKIAQLMLRNNIPIININIDGETQELKSLPLRKKVDRFLNLSKESLSKINMAQIEKLNNLGNSLSSITDDIDGDADAEDQEHEDEAEEEAEDEEAEEADETTD